MRRRIKRFDPYEREYGPTARRASSAMSRYYASVSRAIKRALSGGKKTRRRATRHGKGR